MIAFFAFLMGICSPYMAIWGSFLMQMRVAEHEKSNLECVKFINV